MYLKLTSEDPGYVMIAGVGRVAFCGSHVDVELAVTGPGHQFRLPLHGKAFLLNDGGDTIDSFEPRKDQDR